MNMILDDLTTEVIVPSCHPELPRRLGVRPMVGILLHGPPGCGKAKLARAIANETGVPFDKFLQLKRFLASREAAKLVQLSTRREGFSSIPNIRWEDVGGLDSLRKAFDRYIIQRIKHPEDYEITGIPVLFISAMEGRGGVEVMHQVVDAYQKWCSRLSTARLNRWLRKVMRRHSWKDQAAQPKIKYFTQVKARPPTFVCFLSGKAQLSDTDIRFLIKSLKEDFTLGGIPIRIMQRCISTKTASSNNSKNPSS